MCARLERSDNVSDGLDPGSTQSGEPLWDVLLEHLPRRNDLVALDLVPEPAERELRQVKMIVAPCGLPTLSPVYPGSAYGNSP